MVVFDVITERKSAQAALEERERRFRSMIENASDLIVMIDAAGLITYTSPSLERLGGYTAGEVLGRNVLEFAHPDDLAAASKAFSDVLHSPCKTIHTELRWLHKGGAPVILDAILKNGLDNPALRAIIINARDVTSRRRAEIKIRQSEARFRVVLEQSIAAIYVIQNGKIVYVNHRMREIFGYARDEAFDPDPLVHIAESERARVTERMSQRRGKQVLGAYELVAMRKDGSLFTLGVHAKLASYQGEPAIIAVAQDITEKARAEAEVQRYILRLEQAMHSTIKVVSIIGELRDPYTAGHERRVGEIAAAIAGEMALSPAQIEGVRIAGYLHDVGKIVVPAEILAKPTRLTKAEFDLLKDHAQQGYDILKGVEFPWPVAEIALQHHERVDGSGYPRGLRGEAILREAKIIAVADTIEAMATHRPYRPSLGIDNALAEIERGSGTAYDSDVVDVCLRLFRQKGYQLPS
jgi:PAS domain S-box-containing protein/putative nucleotidyltransferase with HDIG domain